MSGGRSKRTRPYEFQQVSREIVPQMSVTRPDIGHGCPAGGQSGHAPIHFNELVAKFPAHIVHNTCAYDDQCFQRYFSLPVHSDLTLQIVVVPDLCLAGAAK
jgi:hypothetical protein